MPEASRGWAGKAARLLDAMGGAGAAVAVAALAALPVIGAQLYRATFRVPLNYNEGYMAYHSVAALSGGDLYFPSESFLGNTYPPISYFVFGAAGELAGDHIFGGRAVATLGFMVAVVLTGLIARRLTDDWRLGLLSALLAAAFFAELGSRYIGMSDPSLLAHAVMMGAALLFFSRDASRRRLVAALILMVVAGLVKNNLLAFPMAAVLGLLLQDRQAGARAVLYGGGIAAAALALGYLAFGRPMFDSMLASRPYVFGPVIRQFTEIVLPLQLPIAVSLLGFVASGAQGDRLVLMLYALFAAVLGASFAGGAGTNVNVWFDLLFAVAILAPVAVKDIAARLAERGAPELRVRGLLALTTCFGILLSLPNQIAGVRYGLIHDAMPAWEAESTADIEYLAARGNPVLCELQSLCYWAGLDHQVDVFHTTRMGDPRSRQVQLADSIATRRYRAIHLLAGSLQEGMARFHPTVGKAIEQAYQMERVDRNGVFLVPR